MLKFQSILLVTSDDAASLKHHFNLDINISTLDTLILRSDKSIGIQEIKTAKQFALIPPVTTADKYIIIVEAQRLTLEAQNALLKLLEEPPAYLRIVLTLANRHQLLETIISRCQVLVDTPKPPTPSAADQLLPLLTPSPQFRLDHLPPTTTKEAALTFCQELISAAREHLHQSPGASAAENLTTLLQCQTRLNQNANPTTTITDAVLSLLPLAGKPATMASVAKEN